MMVVVVRNIEESQALLQSLRVAQSLFFETSQKNGTIVECSQITSYVKVHSGIQIYFFNSVQIVWPWSSFLSTNDQT